MVLIRVHPPAIVQKAVDPCVDVVAETPCHDARECQPSDCILEQTVVETARAEPESESV